MVNKIVTSLSWELSKGQGAGTGTGLGGAKHHTSASAAGITAAGRQGDGRGTGMDALHLNSCMCLCYCASENTRSVAGYSCLGRSLRWKNVSLTPFKGKIGDRGGGATLGSL